MLPVLKKGSNGPTVKDLQRSLNRSRDIRHDSKLAPLEPDGKFGSLTEARVQEYQKARALVPDGRVGPKTRGFLFEEAYDRVTAAQRVASGWVMLARAAIVKLRGFAARAQGGAGRPPGPEDRVDVEALKTHFHIDTTSLSPAEAASAARLLDQIEQTYNHIFATLNRASIENEVIFRRVGTHEMEADHIAAGAGFPFRSSAYVLRKGDRMVSFAPPFNEDEGLLVQRILIRNRHVNTVIHECAHLASLDIRDIAYNFAPPGSQTALMNNGKQYSRLTPDEALRNADCYGNFAQHVVFRVDALTSDPEDLFSIKCTTELCR